MNNKKSDQRAGEKRKKEILFRTNLSFFLFFFWFQHKQNSVNNKKQIKGQGKNGIKDQRKYLYFFYFI